MNYDKVGISNPLLAGLGMINIRSFCETFETNPEVVLQETLNYSIPIYCIASNWKVYQVDDYREIEREDTGGFVLNSVIAESIENFYSGYLTPFNPNHTIHQIIATGTSIEETAFRLNQNTKSCFFLDLPGVDLTINDLLISKPQGEGIRARWALSLSSSPVGSSHTKTSTSSLAAPTTALSPKSNRLEREPSEYCNPSFIDIATSSGINDFIDFKSSAWTEETKIRARSMLGLFIEIMNDPALGEIDRTTIKKYIEKLKRTPHHRDIAKKKLKTNDINKLIELADNTTQRMSSESIKKHIDKLSQYFRWLKSEGFLRKIPTEEIIAKPKKTASDQGKRSVFSDQELELIFSATWFKTGSDHKNSRNGFTYYRPYQYWLPLLAIYTGGRINELAQLYLKDISQTNKGSKVYYIDFNLEGSGKINGDPSDSGEVLGDKSLKTTNSERIVPIHNDLIELGFLDYVDALKKQGYERLFPELKKDRIKGFGKPATSFFNERFFGTKLGIPRDGKKTFHSFRHMFITKLWELDTPEHIIAQMAGHSRGETQSARNYRKDMEAHKLQTSIDRIKFPLPKIARFNIADGLVAVKCAIRRKTSNTRMTPAE